MKRNVLIRIAATAVLIVSVIISSFCSLEKENPVAKVGGLLHAMLPLSKTDPEKAKANPNIFVDTGVPRLLDEVCSIGAEKSRLQVKAAGCSRPEGENEMFKIGERNYSVLKKILWKNNILLEFEDIGGTANRSVNFNITTGEVIITT